MKRALAILLGAMISVTAAAPAFAGVWKTGANGWWYDNQDGTYAAGGWMWIDGNGDGIAECYYFGDNGYLWTDAKTPDGFLVNNNGQWVQNGQIMTKEVGGAYNPASRTYAWLNGIYRAEDGRTITLDAAGGSQMSAAFYCYSEDGWNTHYESGQVDENTRSIKIYYQNSLGQTTGYHQLFLDVEGKELYVQSYDLNNSYIGSWYDGMYRK